MLEVHIIQSLVSSDETVMKSGFWFHLQDVDDLFSRVQHASTFFYWVATCEITEFVLTHYEHSIFSHQSSQLLGT